MGIASSRASKTLKDYEVLKCIFWQGSSISWSYNNQGICAQVQ